MERQENRKASKTIGGAGMKIKIDCKHAKPYDNKHIKCTRDNSIRNVVKKCCAYDCPHYKKKRWF